MINSPLDAGPASPVAATGDVEVEEAMNKIMNLISNTDQDLEQGENDDGFHSPAAHPDASDEPAANDKTPAVAAAVAPSDEPPTATTKPAVPVLGGRPRPLAPVRKLAVPVAAAGTALTAVTPTAAPSKTDGAPAPKPAKPLAAKPKIKSVLPSGGAGLANKLTAPKGPTKAKSAYMFFSADIRAKLKEEGVSNGDIMRITAERWKALAASDKEPFESQAAKDKTRYAAEVAKYEQEHGEKPPTGRATKAGKGGTAAKEGAAGKKKPAAPRTKSAYMLFCDAKRAQAKQENPDADFGAVTKIVSQWWRELGDSEKAAFQVQAADAKLQAAGPGLPAPAADAAPKVAAAPRKRKVEKRKKDAVEDYDSDDLCDDTEDEERPPKKRPARAATKAAPGADADAGDGEGPAPAIDEERDDDEPEFPEVEDWSAEVPEGILFHVPERRDRSGKVVRRTQFAVKLQGKGCQALGMWDPAEHAGTPHADAVPRSMIEEYYARREAYDAAIAKCNRGNYLDLEDVGSDPALDALEMSSFLGHLQAAQFPLHVANKAHARVVVSPSSLFPGDSAARLPIMGTSFVAQRVLDIERRRREALEAELAALRKQVACVQGEVAAAAAERGAAAQGMECDGA
ncbi:unnamed protein product [Pedinophyceae sp. YPF-701]|nr:unnamed protein product [Pedinophyceae sp. YPF-701]